MTIEELSSKTNSRYVTARFTYEEVRDMANGLYHACRDNPEYKGIRDKCKFLFDMVKHGMIQLETAEIMSGCIEGQSEAQEQQKETEAGAEDGRI